MGNFSRKMKRKEISEKEKKVIKLAYDRGYEEGRKQGINDTVDYLSLKMDELEKIEGIGVKTALKVATHFGFEVIQTDTND